MIDMTHEREADAAYIRLGKGKIVETDKVGRLISDTDGSAVDSHPIENIGAGRNR